MNGYERLAILRYIAKAFPVTDKEARVRYTLLHEEGGNVVITAKPELGGVTRTFRVRVVELRTQKARPSV